MQGQRRSDSTGTTAVLERAFQHQSLRSLERVTLARTVMFLAILVWLHFNYGAAVSFANAPIMALFIANGLAAYWLGKHRATWAFVPFVVVALDTVLLGFTLFAPGRTYPDTWPWATVLRQPSFLYFLTIMALSTLSLQPALVLWSGFMSVAVWLTATWLILNNGSSFSTIPDDPVRWLEVYLAAEYVHMDDVWVRVFVTMMIAVILALAVYRARELVREQAAAARERANLARYVAPNLVERLAQSDRPMGGARSLMATVLFADIKGFTARSERLGPEGTMDFLRRFHGSMAEIVFEHAGTLDKFIGDGLMATFGTPENGKDDATRAIRCAAAMVNTARGIDNGEDDNGIELAVGLHHGAVTIGDIGGAGRFEFAVIGDAVNVASRLERLTRDHQVAILISGSTVTQAEDEGFDTSSLQPIERDSTLRGRQHSVDVWTLKD